MEEQNMFLWIKAAVTALCAAFSAAFGWLGWLVLAWAVCMVIDWISGSAAAASKGEWSSAVARAGIWHKAGMVVVVIVAAMADGVLGVAVENLPVLGIQYTVLILPVVLVWYIFTELGSKWLIFISVGLPFLSVIVLMKILSGQGIVEVLGLTVLYLFSLTLAYLINFFFNICFGFSAFVFKNLWGSNLLKTSIVAFMSGSLIPLAFFPKVVSDILSFLPFSSLIYTPVMIIVGKYDASQILQALLLQFFWLIVMVGLSQLIWKRVQSFITIQGG